MVGMIENKKNEFWNLEFGAWNLEFIAYHKAIYETVNRMCAQFQ
jgi:hypothetical protein